MSSRGFCGIIVTMIMYYADWSRYISRYPGVVDNPPKHVLRTVSDLCLRLPRGYSGNRMLLPRSRTGGDLVTVVKREILNPHQPDQKLMVDSGSYALMSHAGMREAGGVQRAQKYDIKRNAFHNAFSLWLTDKRRIDLYASTYIDEILPMVYDVVENFVELDIGALVGEEMVDSWRRRIERSGYAERCILVCHEPTDEDEDRFLDMAADWPCRTVGVPVIPGVSRRRFVEAAAERGLRVHGFSASSPSELFTTPYYSVDSTRWGAPVIWARIDKWNPIHRTFDSVPLSKRSRCSAEWSRARRYKRPIDDVLMPYVDSDESRNIALVRQIRECERMMRDVTRYWESKGVT